MSRDGHGSKNGRKVSRSVLGLKVGGRPGKRRVGSHGFENVRVFEASSALAVRF